MRAMTPLLTAGAAWAACAQAATFDPALLDVMRDAKPDEVVSALVYLVDQVDAAELTAAADAVRASRSLRHEMVVRSLQSMAKSTQPQLLGQITAAKSRGEVESYEAFWVGNIIRIDATPDFIMSLADHRDIDYIYFNYPIELIEPVSRGEVDDGDGGRSIEPGVAAVRAPEVWAMGITGEGVLVANIDTGVAGNHPALASRWRGVADPRYANNPEWAWYDPYTNNNNFPFDNNGHGTHCMGSTAGDAPGNQIGVAPGAQWIAAGAIDRGGGIGQTVADAIKSFQWIIDPDGDPSTSWDVPDVCSNSWGLVTGHGYPPCDTTFWVYLDNCEAAGIVMIFAAGNEGSGANTLRRPADRATNEYRSMAVAAVDANNPNWPIAGFSSRGPTYCTPDGTAAIKPDIAAPGVNVRSSVPGGGYSSFSGTSMAAPHVNGVVALMRQANPDISVTEIMQIIYDTAYDLGPAGKDNTYGWGMIDAYEAVNVALDMVSLRFEFPDGLPELLDPNGGTTITVEVSGQNVNPEPGSGRFYYSDGDGGWIMGQFPEIAPNVYEAVFPAFACHEIVNYYFTAQTTDGDLVAHPRNAPAESLSALSLTGTLVMFEDTFDTDLGWVSGAPDDDATTGHWVRDDPIGTNWQGQQVQPDSPYIGSACWITGQHTPGQGVGYNDVDHGKTTLFSPILELAGQDEVRISYWRWYSNHAGANPFNDIFVVDISNDGGQSWVNVETVGPSGPQVMGGWYHYEFRVADVIPLTNQIQVRFVASDYDPQALVEAAVDWFVVSMPYCDDPDCPEDLNGDGYVDLEDLAILLAAYGSVPGDPNWNPSADIDGNGIVDQGDLALLLSAYGQPCP